MLDIFNRKKVKKLEAYVGFLEDKVRRQEQKNDELRDELNEWKKKYNKLKLEVTLNK